MKRRTKIFLLLSHACLFACAGAAGVWHVQRNDDPLYALASTSILLADRDGVGGPLPLNEQELRRHMTDLGAHEVGEWRRELTVDRLITLSALSRLVTHEETKVRYREEAREVCLGLRWRDCSEATLERLVESKGHP